MESGKILLVGGYGHGRQSRTTSRSSEETEDDEKRQKLSAYQSWDQRGCVRTKLWYF